MTVQHLLQKIDVLDPPLQSIIVLCKTVDTLRELHNFFSILLKASVDYGRTFPPFRQCKQEGIKETCEIQLW